MEGPHKHTSSVGKVYEDLKGAITETQYSPHPTSFLIFTEMVDVLLFYGSFLVRSILLRKEEFTPNLFTDVNGNVVLSR